MAFKLTSIKRTRRIAIDDTVELEFEVMPISEGLKFATEFQQSHERGEVAGLFDSLTQTINKHLIAIYVNKEKIDDNELDISDISETQLVAIIRAISEPDPTEIEEAKKKQIPRPIYRMK